MESAAPGSEALLKEKKELLQEICRLYESAQLAAREDDLDGAAAPGERAEKLLARLKELDRRLPPGRTTPEIDALLERARGLHASLIAALEEEKEKVGRKIHTARAFRRMLKGYRRPTPPTGRRLNVTDQ